jgi:hypothetical protein
MDAYQFQVFARRWKAKITYQLVFNANGWIISHIAINGQTDPEGVPILGANFEQDNICFPSGVGSFLGHVWREIQSGEIDKDIAQKKIQEIADWVTVCEKSQPNWPEWN